MRRFVVELVSALRRAGLSVSPAETLDAVQALSAVGVERRVDVVAALRCCLLRADHQRADFDRVVQAYLDRRGAGSRDLFERLAEAGFAAAELEVLRGLVDALEEGPARALAATFVGTEAQRALAERLIAGLPRELWAPERAGYGTMRALEAAELPRARTQLEQLRNPLADQLGRRGLDLADALERELSALHRTTRAALDAAAQRGDLPLNQLPFAELDADQLSRMERVVQRLSDRLLSSQRVRARRARRGRFDPRATLRRALATHGVPMRPAFRRPRRRQQTLFVLCDISDSVRASARLSLTFLYAAQQVLGEVRSFVFVSDVGEATRLFAERPSAEAISRAYQGDVVRVADNSNYGHALARFEQLAGSALCKRDTLLVVGDARSNHFPPREAVLERLARRVRRAVWLNPQPRALWGQADCAMPRYLPHLTAAYDIPDLAHFEAAVRALARGA